MLVSFTSIVFMVFSLLLIFLFPIGLIIFMHRRYRISIKALLVGAAVFIIFQLLTRIPLLGVLARQPWYEPLAQNLFFNAVIIGGLTAGLFEETGRYLGFRYILKNELSWENGIAYGIGHGGFEAMGLVGLNFINNIVLSLMINSGIFDSMIVPQIGEAAAGQIKNILITTPPVDFLFGGLERIFTLTVQLALSLIVLYAVMKRKAIFLLLAILLHAAVNAPAVILLVQGFGTWAAELYLFLLAAAATVFVVKSKGLFQREENAVE